MNLITVIPLSRAKVAETLSYFTAAEVPVGAIVTVPLRSKSIHAIVSASRPAEDLKAEIKGASFEIRKLGHVKTTAFFPKAFMEACDTVADFYAATPGRIIDTVVANVLLENASRISPPLPHQTSFLAAPPSPDETYAIQGEDEDRMSSWRSLIRQEFARKRSVAFYVPTIEDASAIYKTLEKGIEGYIFMLHSGLTKKKALEVWATIAETAHPVVVVATASFSVLPRGDIECVVIERENARGWMTQKSPHIDLRHALETIARKRRQTVYLADCLLRAETLHRLDEHEISQGSPFKWRSVSSAKDTLVNMVFSPSNPARGTSGDTSSSLGGTEIEEASEETKTSIPKHFRVLSPELETLIERNRDESTHLFIMTVRRGLATATVCDDCETIVVCAHCSAPVVLHTSKESGKNFFMCHKCGTRRSADETCKVCGSWRLTPLGIGIERVEQEIRARFPDIDVSVVDADTTKTDKQIAAAINKFRAKPGSILLGTETALLHLSEKVDHAAVASLDSLFALPDFRIEEKIVYTLIRLRGISSRSILVQTRRPDEKAFEYGLKGNLSDFYRATADERKHFRYPPFSVLVKVSIEGKKDAIARTMADVKALVAPNELDVFPAFTATVRNNSVIHGLLKLETHAWPDKDLIAKLKSLPPNVSVKVNPESLL